MAKARRRQRASKGVDPLRDLHEYGVDLRHRELYLVGEPDAIDPSEIAGDRNEPGVEFSMANRIIKNLRALALASTAPILIHMKTCGGDEAEGFAIYDAVRACPLKTTILSYTHARSMSSIILQAADKRVLMPSSYFMFHRGDAAVSGVVRAVESAVAFFKPYDELMVNLYVEAVKRSGRPAFKRWSRVRLAAHFNKMMDQKVDVFLPAEEAVAWGLADEIFDGNWAALAKAAPKAPAKKSRRAGCRRCL